MVKDSSTNNHHGKIHQGAMRMTGQHEHGYWFNWQDAFGNGSLIVKMQCRGHRELIWELMHPDWLGFVQIESPDRIKEEYAEQLERAKLAV